MLPTDTQLLDAISESGSSFKALRRGEAPDTWRVVKLDGTTTLDWPTPRQALADALFAFTQGAPGVTTTDAPAEG